MYHYVLWGDIQKILEEQRDRGSAGTFSGAYETAVQTVPKSAEELIFPDFDAWDCESAADLFELFRALPVTYSSMGGPFVQRVYGQFHYEFLDFHANFQIAPLVRYETAYYNNDCFSVFYLLGGTARLTVDTEQFELAKGSFYITAPNVSYQFYGRSDCAAVALLIWKKGFSDVFLKILRRKNILTDYYSQFLNGGPKKPLQFHMADQANIFVRTLLKEFFCPNEYSEEVCVSLVEVLLIYAIREGTVEFGKKENAREHGLYPPGILQYIHEHYTNVTLEELASVFGYAPGYLSRQLKLATGKSFQALILDERIHEAKRLLRYTELSLEEISEQLGYSSPVSFSRLFSKEVSMPPSIYRQKCRIE